MNETPLLNEISPAILHPPLQPFYQKVNVSSQSLKKRNSLLPLIHNILPLSTKNREAIEICRIPPEKRTIEELQILIKATENMQYFQEMNKKSVNKSERIHERICVVMRYDFKKKGEIIFNFEEKSNKFFIILSGSVNILLPKTHSNIVKEKLESVKTKKTFFRLQKHKQDSHNSLNENEENFEESTTVKARFENILQKYHDLLGGLGLQDLNSRDMDNLFEEGVLKFNYYGTLKEGQTFGELGILTGKLRSATVICKEDCHLAYLGENDYKTIVSVIERKKIYDKFEFFKSFLIKDASNEIIRKLSYSFEKIKYKRMEYVFKEGEESKSVFLLKKGEIQIQKWIYDQENTKKLPSKLPFNPFASKKKKILINLLTGEFFGEEELLENKLIEKEEKLKRKFSAFVSSSTATVYACPLPFFKKFLLERPALYSRFHEQFIIKREIREKQFVMCLQQEKNKHIPTIKPSKAQEIYGLKGQNLENFELSSPRIARESSFLTNFEIKSPRIYENFSNNSPWVLKKSLEEYKNRLKSLSIVHTEGSEYFDKEKNSYFSKNFDRNYDNFIVKRIKYLNEKPISSCIKENLNVFDDIDTIDRIIKKKLRHKKMKSMLEMSKIVRTNESILNAKPLQSQRKKITEDSQLLIRGLFFSEAKQ